MVKKHILRILSIVVVMLIIAIFEVSCGQTYRTHTPQDQNTSQGTFSQTSTSSEGIIVAKPTEQAGVSVFLKKTSLEGGTYQFEFYVENKTKDVYEYTSNNGCVVNWKVFKKTDAGWEKVYPEKPPVCTQQIVVVSVPPGGVRKISSFVMPSLGTGTFLVQGSMGNLVAQQIVEVK